MAIQPIFIFSLPRSGSTLVQRIIAAHDGVATTSEPWILLPHLYAFRQQGVMAEYDHSLMVHAIQDFCKELPAGEADYRQGLREFILSMYEKAAGGDAVYFLDKTPPYCLIADEIMDLFPDAKFVFLWRNPLSVIASIILTLNDEHWHPTLFREDLFVGLPRLVSAYQTNRARAYSVRFEDLLDRGEDQWRPLMSYLGIEFDSEALNRFTEIELNGRMGDPTGIKQYSALSSDPIDKWRGTLANPLRRAWCHRYLRFLGPNRLLTMGYDLDQLLDQLHSQPLSTSSLLADFGGLVSDLAKEPLRVRMRRRETGEGTNVLRELLRA
jgi:hypothetical protein